MLTVFRAEQLVLDIEVGHNAVGLLFLPGLVSVCHRVTDSHDVGQLCRSVVTIVRRHTVHGGVHQEIITGVIVKLVHAPDAGIRCHRQSHGQQLVVSLILVTLAATIGIVLQVVRIGQREVS